MPILSVKYPIIFRGSQPGFNFTISLDGSVIYEGLAVNNTIDISTIFQTYMNADLVDVTDENLPVVSARSAVKRFTVTDGTTTTTYLVANDYNDEYITQYLGDYITSESITGVYHPDGLIFVDVNSESGNANIQIGSASYTGSNQITTTISERTEVFYEKSGYVDLAMRVQYHGIKYSDDTNLLYTYGGNPYTICLSSDGENWNVFKSVVAQNHIIRDLVYKNSTYTGCSSNGRIAFIDEGGSLSGTGFSTIPDTSYFTSIAELDDIYISFANYSDSDGTIYVKGSRTTWQQKKLPISGTTAYVQSGNGLFSLAATYTTYYSNDLGDTWIQGQNSLVGVINQFKFTGNKFIILRDAGGVEYSDDGITYINGNSPATNFSWVTVCYGNDTYYFFGYIGNTLYCGSTSNFNDWTFKEIGGLILTNRIYDSIFFNDKIILVGDNSQYHILNSRVEPADISVNGQPITYDITEDDCIFGTLYWVNRKGGRSQMILTRGYQEYFENNSTRYDSSYDRTTPNSFETKTINNMVTRRWTVYSPPLDDLQSQRMSDLFTSPKVWLHNHQDGKIYAVYITDSQVRIQHRPGDQNLYYTINIRQAQKHIRR